MIELANFPDYETIMVKMPRDRQTSTIQRWRLDPKEAEVLFGTLSVLLDGDPNVGPILFQQRSPVDGLAIVAVTWRSRDGAVRSQILEQFDEIEPMVRQTADACLS